MNLNIDLKNLFKKNTTSQSAHKGPNPWHDWKIMIIIFLMLMSTFLAFGVYLFWMENSGALFTSVDQKSQPVETLDRNGLHKLITAFEEKRTNVNNLKLSEPEIKDPSL